MCEESASIDNTDCVGLDPTRTRRKSPFDYIFVVAAVIVALLLVVWALLG